MKKISSILLALVLVLSLVAVTTERAAAEGSALAITPPPIHVPGDFPTIQAAIDAAEPGDTIVVEAGEYDGFVVQYKHNITITSTEGATVTTANSFLLYRGIIGEAWVMAGVFDSENINIEGIGFDGTNVTGEQAVVGIAYVDSTGSIVSLRVENIGGTEVGVGVAVIGLGEGSVEPLTAEVKGCTISNNSDIGIYVCDLAVLEAQFNNIVGNSVFGILNDGGGTVDATYNWWGHASGPFEPTANPGGAGNPVSDDVIFKPWVQVPALTATVTDGTVDAKGDADTEVGVTGTATVTVTKSTSNPGGDPPAGITALGRYIDVYVPDTSQVTEIEIRLYYTDDDVGNISKTLQQYLRLRWWDGSEWRPYSDGGVNTDGTVDYAGYIWAKVRADTEPSLADLTGTWNGDYWEGPTDIGCGCFIATAAYGTDTARELDILREFRDTVLLPDSLGARFVSLYYRTSPPVAGFISRYEVLRAAVRVGFVDPIVKILNRTHHLWSDRGS